MLPFPQTRKQGNPNSTIESELTLGEINLPSPEAKASDSPITTAVININKTTITPVNSTSTVSPASKTTITPTIKLKAHVAHNTTAATPNKTSPGRVPYRTTSPVTAVIIDNSKLFLDCVGNIIAGIIGLGVVCFGI